MVFWGEGTFKLAFNYFLRIRPGLLTIFATMPGRYFRCLLSLLVVLHFAGLTQLVSAYARDKASYVSMLNMNEEESKKEKDTTEDDLLETAFLDKQVQQLALVVITEHSVQLVASASLVQHQFIGDQHTPPPNSLV